jgi:tetratricopeptide (TPR) repeat protein
MVKTGDFEADELTTEGVNLFLHGEIEKTIKCFYNALKINPCDASAWFSKGLCFSRPEEKASVKDDRTKMEKATVTISGDAYNGVRIRKAEIPAEKGK